MLSPNIVFHEMSLTPLLQAQLESEVVCSGGETEDSEDTDTDEGEVAGWGAVDVLARRFADVLQYVVVPFADTEECSRLYKVC